MVRFLFCAVLVVLVVLVIHGAFAHVSGALVSALSAPVDAVPSSVR